MEAGQAGQGPPGPTLSLLFLLRPKVCFVPSRWGRQAVSFPDSFGVRPPGCAGPLP